MRSAGSMRGVLDHISQKKKTMLGDQQIVTGWNCMAQSAYEVVIATHVGTDPLHSRIFVNSVSCVDGGKPHQNAAVPTPAAEMIAERATLDSPAVGLTTWKGAPAGKILKATRWRPRTI